MTSSLWTISSIPQPQRRQRYNQMGESSGSLRGSERTRLRTFSPFACKRLGHGPPITDCLPKALILSIVLKYLHFLMTNRDCTKLFFFYYYLLVGACARTEHARYTHVVAELFKTGVKSQSSVVNCRPSRAQLNVCISDPALTFALGDDFGPDFQF